MAEKNIKLVAVKPFMHGGKRIETAETIEVPEGVARDILSTNRAQEATEENVKAAKAAGKKSAG